MILKGQFPPVFDGYDYTVSLSQYLQVNGGPPQNGSYFQLYYSFRDPVLNIGIVADCLSTTCWIGLGVSNQNVNDSSTLTHKIDPVVAQSDYLANQYVTDYIIRSTTANLNSANTQCAAGVAINCAGNKKKGLHMFVLNSFDRCILA